MDFAKMKKMKRSLNDVSINMNQMMEQFDYKPNLFL